MKIKTILFDLDGTLLPMNQDLFIKSYFSALAEKFVNYGYEPKKFVDTVWHSIMDTVKNNGEKTNEEIFWQRFCEVYGEDAKNTIPYFEEFYEKNFIETKSTCFYTENSRKIIDLLKQKGIKIVLATNPVFPRIATYTRMGWVGLKPEDFELVTTYENSRRCKPNIEYYKDIITELSLNPEQCLMVGNDVSDDMVAQNLGMKVFLLTDCLINSKNEDISKYPNGGFRELIKYIGDIC